MYSRPPDLRTFEEYQRISIRESRTNRVPFALPTRCSAAGAAKKCRGFDRLVTGKTVTHPEDGELASAWLVSACRLAQCCKAARIHDRGLDHPNVEFGVGELVAAWLASACRLVQCGRLQSGTHPR